jgi:hypothetical protein
MGARLNPSSPTFSTYFLGTIQPAPVAGVPWKVMKSGQGCLRRKRMRCESTTSMAAMRALKGPAPAPR